MLCVWLVISMHLYTFLFFSLSTSAADVFRLNSLPENESKQLDISASFFEIYSGKVTENGSFMPVAPLHLLPLPSSPYTPQPHLTSSLPYLFIPSLLTPSPSHPLTLSPPHPTNQVFDLLNRKNKLRILEDAKQQVQVHGVLVRSLPTVSSNHCA